MNLPATLARTAALWIGVLERPGDMVRFARLRRLTERGVKGPPVPLHIRPLGGMPLLVRPGQDVWTLKHTFVDGFHRPPAALRDDAVIVDLGSNVGYTVADLAQRHPGARIVGVELDADNYGLAVENTRRFGERVTLVHGAVWTEDGTVAYGGDAADAFHVTPGAPTAGARTAPALRLETLFDRFGLTRVDYLKMDIEGAEAAILGGPLDWAARVEALKVELHPPAELERCRAALESAGFRCTADEHHGNGLVAVRRRGP